MTQKGQVTVSVAGSTGSIGRQTLEVIRGEPVPADIKVKLELVTKDNVK